MRCVCVHKIYNNAIDGYWIKIKYNYFYCCIYYLFIDGFKRIRRMLPARCRYSELTIRCYDFEFVTFILLNIFQEYYLFANKVLSYQSIVYTTACWRWKVAVKRSTAIMSVSVASAEQIMRIPYREKVPISAMKEIMQATLTEKLTDVTYDVSELINQLVGWLIGRLIYYFIHRCDLYPFFVCYNYNSKIS